MESSEYTLLDDNQIKKSLNGCVFCGYLNKNIRQSGVDKDKLYLSRCHKQPNRIYSSNGIHPTISSSETSGRYYIKDERIGEVRKLDIKECFRLMGVPENDIKKLVSSDISKTNLYMLAGNSIVVPVLYNIFKTIFVEK